MRRNGIFKAVLALLVLSAIVFFLPKSDCDDDTDPQEQKLIDKAFAGDLRAISALSALSKKRGVTDMEEYWALSGALLGDLGFQKEYVEFYRKRFSQTQRERVVKIIEDERASPGAPCLLEMIKANLDKPPPCAQR
jgi:hypothetical protein